MNRTFHFRTTDRFFELLTHAAELCGLTNSQFARLKLFDAIDQTLREYGELIETDTERKNETKMAS